MNWYTIITLAIIIGIGFYLHYKKWHINHILSFSLSLIFIFFFAYYGSDLIMPIWHNVNAANLWLAMFFLIYGGSAIMGCIPFIIHRKDRRDKKEFKKIIMIIKFWFVIGLIYTAIDNSTMGPFAVGPNSPYVGESLCKLNPTYYSEDVWFGCILEKIKINPYTELGIFLTYILFTIFLLLCAGKILGYKRLEKLMFIE